MGFTVWTLHWSLSQDCLKLSTELQWTLPPLFLTAQSQAPAQHFNIGFTFLALKFSFREDAWTLSLSEKTNPIQWVVSSAYLRLVHLPWILRSLQYKYVSTIRLVLAYLHVLNPKLQYQYYKTIYPFSHLLLTAVFKIVCSSKLIFSIFYILYKYLYYLPQIVSLHMVLHQEPKY